MKSTTLAAAVATLAMALAAPAYADDPDMEFAHQLHTYGIYGARDYNAWLGKIVCERLRVGRDGDAATSAKFITPNLPRGTSQAQVFQFLGAAILTYCPDQRGVYERAAE